MSESFHDGPVEVGTLTDAVIIDHAIGGIGGHAVFAKTVLGNQESEPHQVWCELRTSSGNFDTVTVTIPPRWNPSRGPAIDGSVSVSLQAIDRPMASIAHFGRLTCRALGGLFVSSATMSKVWAIAVQN
ncbi:hypothetical protein ACFQ9R_16870 [Nocardia sp. NPDC056541]|uniref:hypothetical protein n=1 Tax=Nocardia sp. NPDC056541 TaxID=3345860 RepID=UPI0036713290